MAPKPKKPSNRFREKSRDVGMASQPSSPYLPGSYFLPAERIDFKPFTPKSSAQSRTMDILRSHALTFLVGPAGTGKSFLAAALACELLQKGEAKKIVAARPAVEAGDSIGFIPGSINDKIDPYIRPIVDSLTHFLGSSQVFQQLRLQDTIETTSMTYLRGRSLVDCVILLDEMQNATPEQLKMALTRAGENSKVVVTLDPDQCDLAEHLASAAEDLPLFENRQGIAVIRLTNQDVVRSKLVKDVLAIYQQAA